MPRKADRRKAMDWMERRVYQQQKAAVLRELLDDEDSVQDDQDAHTAFIYERMKNKRYLFRPKVYRKNRKKFDLNDCLSYNSQNYSEEEFLYCFRLSRESFFLLLEEMGTKKAFKYSKFKQQRPIAFQLLVFLFRIGKEGTGGGALSVSTHFGIGKGSVKNYVRRCVLALHEIKDDVIRWPDTNDRDAMRARLAAYGFRHCVGIIDGTLVVLDFKPEKFHECYYCRKCCYALNVMIVCDDRKRVTYYNAGWPGSTHDNRVFRNSRLFRKREEYFRYGEYLLGDSAYSCSSIMVQSFKKFPGAASLPRDQENFNTLLAQVRISSEHCIGILKGRFQCLKRNNIKLKDSPKEVKELVDLIGACIVIHNLLINYDEDTIPKKWYTQMEEEIDWSLFDENDQNISNVNKERASRRKIVFDSIINTYFV
jgi:hypothetical protein